MNQNLQLCALLVIGCMPLDAMSQVFTVGAQFEPPSESLNMFGFDGELLQQTDVPELVYSMVAYGDRILGTSSRTVLEFDRAGNYVGVFATVPNDGEDPRVTFIESDEAGNVYLRFAWDGGEPLTSYRLNPNGEISQTFAHPELTNLDGIDAGPDGTTYILQRNDLYAFDLDGDLKDVFELPEIDGAHEFTISESLNELYVSDEIGKAIHIYDLASGTPIHLSSIPTIHNTGGIFVEPTSHRIFATAHYNSADTLPWGASYGFEMDRSGNILARFTYEDQQILGASDIVAFVPEPSCWLLALVSWMSIAVVRRREEILRANFNE
ncbi:MAG: hypothetical protein AAF497_05015 [Planctomycetota bacterium]